MVIKILYSPPIIFFLFNVTLLSEIDQCSSYITGTKGIHYWRSALLLYRNQVVVHATITMDVNIFDACQQDYI